jgi:hypothetical protein
MQISDLQTAGLKGMTNKLRAKQNCVPNLANEEILSGQIQNPANLLPGKLPPIAPGRPMTNHPISMDN